MLISASRAIEPEITPLLSEGAAAALSHVEGLLPGASQHSVSAIDLTRVIERCKELYKEVADLPLTPRVVPKYEHELGIPRWELDTPGRLALDVGAGMQNLARSAKAMGLRTTIVSAEPRVAHPETDRVVAIYRQHAAKETFDPINNERHALLKARAEAMFNPDPKTVGAYAHMLPFRNGTFDNLYASWSVPHYTELHQLDEHLSEFLRVLKPGGIARIYPIEKEQIVPIRRWLMHADVEFPPRLEPHLGLNLLTFAARI